MNPKFIVPQIGDGLPWFTMIYPNWGWFMSLMSFAMIYHLTWPTPWRPGPGTILEPIPWHVGPPGWETALEVGLKSSLDRGFFEDEKGEIINFLSISLNHFQSILFGCVRILPSIYIYIPNNFFPECKMDFQASAKCSDQPMFGRLVPDHFQEKTGFHDWKAAVFDPEKYDRQLRSHVGWNSSVNGLACRLVWHRWAASASRKRTNIHLIGGFNPPEKYEFVRFKPIHRNLPSKIS